MSSERAGTGAAVIGGNGKGARIQSVARYPRF